ncbi:MAG: hypothetical protein ACRDRX_23420 [Pseudonocardiaceae bacterium]
MPDSDEPIGSRDRARHEHQQRIGDRLWRVTAHSEDYREAENDEHYHHAADRQQRATP